MKKLGYFTYNNTARIALYHLEAINAVLEYTDATGAVQVIACEAKGTSITVSKPFPQGRFTLKMWQFDKLVGQLIGDFFKGDSLILAERSGAFSGISAHKLTDQETVQALKTEECPGIAPTDIMLISRKWSGWQLIVGQKKIKDWQIEEWDDAKGIRSKEWMGRRRINAQSVEYGQLAGSVHAGLVAVLSGTYAGRSGWLLWGDEAGLAVSGALGDVSGALWMPGLESFPNKVKEKISLPPVSVAGTGTRKAGNMGMMTF